MRQTISNDINLGDMPSSKCKIKTKYLKSDQPYKVHHTGNYEALGRQDWKDSLVVAVGSKCIGPKGSPNHAAR